MFKRRLLRRSEGDRILYARYRELHNRELDLLNARTFTEKLYRRMLDVNRRGNETFTRLADKLGAREYVADRAGPQYLTPLIWSGSNPASIPFETLPAKSIAKTNHGCGSNIVLTHPIDGQAVIRELTGWLNTNFYWASREAQYYPIEPQVMIEQYIDDDEPLGPLDYRVWCFSGNPAAIQVDNHAHTLNAFYTTSWQLTDATYRSTDGIREAKRPDNLDELLSIASRLSEPFDFVRIDLYSARGKIFFGEFTFTPTAGRHKFDPPHWDLYFGEKWL